MENFVLNWERNSWVQEAAWDNWKVGLELWFWEERSTRAVLTPPCLVTMIQCVWSDGTGSRRLQMESPRVWHTGALSVSSGGLSLNPPSLTRLDMKVVSPHRPLSIWQPPLLQTSKPENLLTMLSCPEAFSYRIFSVLWWRVWKTPSLMSSFCSSSTSIIL